MKKLLLVLLIFAFISTGFANDNPVDTGPPSVEKVTLNDVLNQSKIVTSFGWDAIAVDLLQHSEGKFVFITYEQENLGFGYASPVIIDFTKKGYNSIREKILKTRLKIPVKLGDNYIYKHQARIYSSSGGMPYWT